MINDFLCNDIDNVNDNHTFNQYNSNGQHIATHQQHGTSISHYDSAYRYTGKDVLQGDNSIAQYDSANHYTGTIHHLGSTDFHYDASGQLTMKDVTNGNIVSHYDGKTNQYIGQTNLTTGREYNNLNQLVDSYHKVF